MKGRTGTTRAEIESAVEQIVAAVLNEHGLTEATDPVMLGSKLQDDLGMEEVDQMEVLFRAEEQFGIVLPDHGLGPSSQVSDIVGLIADRLTEKEAQLAPAQALPTA